MGWKIVHQSKRRQIECILRIMDYSSNACGPRRKALKHSFQITEATCVFAAYILMIDLENKKHPHWATKLMVTENKLMPTSP